MGLHERQECTSVLSETGVTARPPGVFNLDTTAGLGSEPGLRIHGAPAVDWPASAPGGTDTWQCCLTVTSIPVPGVPEPCRG